MAAPSDLRLVSLMPLGVLVPRYWRIEQNEVISLWKKDGQDAVSHRSAKIQGPRDHSHCSRRILMG